MTYIKFIKFVLLGSFYLILLSSCNGKLPGGDARKTPADPAKRIEQNLKDGRGISLLDIGKQKEKSEVKAQCWYRWTLRAEMSTIRTL